MESLYESYIMKKHLNITKMEVRKKMRSNLNALHQYDKSLIMEKLNDTEHSIQYLTMSKDTVWDLLLYN